MAYEKKILDSDRYQFLKEYQEGAKIFTIGSIIRASFGDMLALLESGIVKEVAAYTLCRENPLAAGGCVPDSNKELQITEKTQAGEKVGNTQTKK